MGRGAVLLMGGILVGMRVRGRTMFKRGGEGGERAAGVGHPRHCIYEQGQVC